MLRTPPGVLDAYTASDARSEGRQYWTPVRVLKPALYARSGFDKLLATHQCRSLPPFPLYIVRCSQGSPES